MEIADKNLCIFTINFPYSTEENFLYNEVMHLSQRFKTIELFPMHFEGMEQCYQLPMNVKVNRFNMFQPYNRVHELFVNFFSIVGIYTTEILSAPYRVRYLKEFVPSLNNLLHKIAMARSFNTTFKLGANTVYYTYWFNQWTFLLALVNKKHQMLPLYTRIHGSDVYEEQHREKSFFFPFRIFQLRQLKKVIAISANGKAHLDKVNNIRSDKTLISRLGVPDKGHNPELKNGTFRIVSCSAFQKYKRVHLIARILEHMRYTVEWVHFGDGELRNEILEIAKTLPETVSFKWMGQKSNEELMQFYQNCHVDLFINVSETEGIPVTIMEALSFGIPVIAPRVGGIAEIINVDNGYLIEKDFDPAVVCRIIEELRDAEFSKTSAMRHAAKRSWQDNYFSEKNYNRLADILRDEKNNNA